MFTEYEIRRRVASLREAGEQPAVSRASALLSLADEVRRSAFRLAQLSNRLLEEGKTDAATRMEEATQRLLETVAEVREAASEVIQSADEHPLKFQVAPCKDAYPRWMAPEDVLRQAS